MSRVWVLRKVAKADGNSVRKSVVCGLRFGIASDSEFCSLSSPLCVKATLRGAQAAAVSRGWLGMSRANAGRFLRRQTPSPAVLEHDRRHDRHSFAPFARMARSASVASFAPQTPWGSVAWPMKARPLNGAQAGLCDSVQRGSAVALRAGRDSDEDNVATAASGRMDTDSASGSSCDEWLQVAQREVHRHGGLEIRAVLRPSASRFRGSGASTAAHGRTRDAALCSGSALSADAARM